MEQSKNTSLHPVQQRSITEQERKGEIFKMAFAFEDFARKYGQYHLNESVPQLNIANKKLGKWNYFNSYYFKALLSHYSSFLIKPLLHPFLNPWSS